ncbi:hypothetical protein Tsp_15140, partial [Trichinella spiralis]|uniref:hypothetical protein n=1 Tax=Trichinella spiralis TaxID=6334 RepID=UPI0001EFE0F4
AFDLPLGTTVVARVFVHFERAVATYRVSGVREPEDVREGDRHRREFWTPIAAHAVEDTPNPLFIIQSTHLLAGRTNTIDAAYSMHELFLTIIHAILYLNMVCKIA